MTGYSAFSQYYDVLTENIDYRARAEYFEKIIRRFGGKKGGILLDLACGTGSLSEEMARLGYDVIGVDSSEEMLSMALDKKFESGLPIQYLCQDMTRLDMFGTIDVTICALDSLNHLESLSDIKSAVEKVSLFCEPGGLFIFDMNTPYKHKNILADKTYVYDMEEVFCVWQNEYTGDSDNRVNIYLDFFEKTDGENELYSRSGEDFSEIAFDKAIIEDILSGAGFELLAEYDYDSDELPSEKSEKIVYAAKKKK